MVALAEVQLKMHCISKTFMAFYSNFLIKHFLILGDESVFAKETNQSLAAFMVCSRPFLAIGCLRLAYPEG